MILHFQRQQKLLITVYVSYCGLFKDSKYMGFSGVCTIGSHYLLGYWLNVSLLLHGQQVSWHVRSSCSKGDPCPHGKSDSVRPEKPQCPSFFKMLMIISLLSNVVLALHILCFEFYDSSLSEVSQNLWRQSEKILDIISSFVKFTELAL